MSDVERVKQLLRERVADLAPYLFPNGHREGVHWCAGSVEGELGKSFKICIAGEKAALWGDFADSGKHSRSLLDLWMKARNVDFKTALHEAAEWTAFPLHGRNIEPSRFKPTSTFRTLEDAIVCTERRLNMRDTRRDWYHDRNSNEHLLSCDSTATTRKTFAHFVEMVRAGSLKTRQASCRCFDCRN